MLTWLCLCLAVSTGPVARADGQPVKEGGASAPLETPGEALSRVSGKVVGPGDRKVSDVVIYLEPTDPAPRLAAPRETAVIRQRGAKFAPSLLVIAVGQSVEFRNDEGRPIEHNVFSRSATLPFDLGLYPPGRSKSVTFDEPGVVRLYCSIHRYMDGTIYVCPSPFFARVRDDGHYHINQVPPGEYLIKTWQRRPRYLEQVRPLAVDPGAVLTVNFEMSRK